MNKFVRPNIEAIYEGFRQGVYPSTTQVFALSCVTGERLEYADNISELRKKIEEKYSGTEFTTYPCNYEKALDLDP